MLCQYQLIPRLLCWYINLRSCEEDSFRGLMVFLCIVCRKARCVVFVKYICSSRGAGSCSARQELCEVVVI